MRTAHQQTTDAKKPTAEELLRKKYGPALDLIPRVGGEVITAEQAKNKLHVVAIVPSENQKNFVWDRIKQINKNPDDLAADIRVTTDKEAALRAAMPAERSSFWPTFIILLIIFLLIRYRQKIFGSMSGGTKLNVIGVFKWPKKLVFTFFDNEKEAAKFWRYMVIITVALVVTSLVLMWIFRNQWYLVSWEAFWIAVVCLWLAGAFVHFKTKAATVAAFIILAAGVYGIWDRQKNHKPFAEYMELEEEKPSPVNAKAKKRKKFQVKLPALWSGKSEPPALKGPIPEDIEAAIDKHFGPVGDTVAATAKKICETESSGCNQFEENGDVFRGKIDPDDIGAMGINLGTWYDIGKRYYNTSPEDWPEKARELGFDIFTVDGNIAFAKFLYDNEYGFYKWYKSAEKWNPGNSIEIAGRTLPEAKVIPVPAYGETETYTPPMYSCVTFAEERRRPFKVLLWRPKSTLWTAPIDLYGTSAMQDIGPYERARFMSANGKPATIIVFTAKPPGGDYRNCIRAFK